MRIQACSLVALLGLSSCVDAPAPIDERAGRIVNGQRTTGSPATVMLQDSGGQGFCTGTLITPHIVLTAAHCLEMTRASDNHIFFGSEEGGPGTAIDVVHQLVNPSTDMALMTLEDVGPASPVPAFFGDLAAHLGEPVHIVGFGSISEEGEGFGPKREGMTTLLRVQSDEMYTATALTGPVSGTCYGDSGGPNYMTIGGQEYVVGEIVSGTATCGTGEDISIRTDWHKQWIKDYIAAHEPVIALPDAGPPPAPDAAPDAGTDHPDDGDASGGCGCRVGARAPSGAGLLVLGLLLLSRGLRAAGRRRCGSRRD